MNNMLFVSTDAVLDNRGSQTNMADMEAAIEESYATAPMASVSAVPLDEEELYTSFEEAISERIMAMQSRLSRISNPLLYSQQSTPGPIMDSSASVDQMLPRRFGPAWHRTLLFGSLSLMCMLIGFDIMGFLVLYMH